MRHDAGGDFVARGLTRGLRGRRGKRMGPVPCHVLAEIESARRSVELARAARRRLWWFPEDASFWNG